MVRYHNSGTQKFDDTEHESVNTDHLYAENGPKAVVQNDDGTLIVDGTTEKVAESGSWQTAIQAAADYIDATHGAGEIALVDESYTIDGTVEIPALVSVKGYGRPLLDASSFDGLLFDWNPDADGTNANTVFNRGGVLLENVRIDGSFNLSNQAGIRVNDLNRVTAARAVDFFRLGRSVEVLSQSFTVTVSGCNFDGDTNSPWEIRVAGSGETATPNNLHITECNFISVADSHVRLDSGYYHTISDSYFEKPGSSCIFVNSNFGHTIGDCEFSAGDNGVGIHVETDGRLNVADSSFIGWNGSAGVYSPGTQSMELSMTGCYHRGDGDNRIGDLVRYENGLHKILLSNNYIESGRDMLNKADANSQILYAVVSDNYLYEVRNFKNDKGNLNGIVSGNYAQDMTGTFLWSPEDATIVGNDINGADPAIFGATNCLVGLNNFESSSNMNLSADNTAWMNRGVAQPSHDLSGVTPVYNSEVKKDDGTNLTTGEYAYADTASGVWRAFSDPANSTITY